MGIIVRVTALFLAIFSVLIGECASIQSAFAETEISPGATEPTPLRPGDYATVRVDVETEGKHLVRMVRLEVLCPGIQPGEEVTLADPEEGFVTLAAPVEFNTNFWLFDDQPKHYIVLRATVHTVSGELLGKSVSFCPAKVFESGFFEIAQACIDVQSDREAIVQFQGESFGRVMFNGVGFLFAIEGIILDSPPMADVLDLVSRSVVQRPGLLSMIGIIIGKSEYGFNIDPLKVEIGEVPADLDIDVPAYRLPVLFKINEKLATEFTLTVVPPEPPFGLMAGVVGIVGAHPNKPSQRFSIRTLHAGHRDLGQ